jgi:type I site-specific restriction endonuclease
MNIFDDAEVISRYTLAQAIKDGVLVEIPHTSTVR